VTPVSSALLGATALVQRVAFEIVTRAGGGSGGGRSSGGGGSRSSGGSSGGGCIGGSSSSGFGGGGSGGAASAIGALIFGGVCFFIIIVFVLIAMRSAKKASAHHAGLPSDPAAMAAAMGAMQGMQPQSTQLGNNPYAAQITTRADIDGWIAAIQQHDPAFNEADFLSDCNRAFFTIQQAWTERKPEISRQVMHDGIWQQHKFQIDQYLSLNKQNILENLAIQNTRLVSVHTDESFDTIMVRFFASCADYDIDLSNEKHKIIKGDKSVQDWAEDWVFQRKSNAVTKPNGGTMAKKCPNCGAPLNLDLAGVCAYCRAPVMSGEFDWVLTRIEQLPDYEYAQATIPQ
jgi:predicted lipid-binding transport protein (Tim44 family)